MTPAENAALDLIVIEQDAAALPPEFSDEALAMTFAERYADRLRYVDTWKTWMVWNEARWARDDTRLAFNLARNICREAAAEFEAHESNHKRDKDAKQLASAKTRAAVVTLANDDRRLAGNADQWDTDPDIFNTPEPTP